ncbi:MAG: TonB-dependent receptor [Prevotella sp.]|nr:TonB-dependent receptor [Prevotella sp.]
MLSVVVASNVAVVESYSQVSTKSGITVNGVVYDQDGEVLTGVTIQLKGNTSIGTSTDIDGRFTITIPQEKRTPILVVSYVGMETKEVSVGKSTQLSITLEETNNELSEVVVVGYGSQKKQSIVGSITQVKGDKLEQHAAGITNLGQALSGMLPGVSTIQITGMPGNDDPSILIRGQSTWNNAQPLILVDGIERRMNDVDMSEVESVSVLKDASATAVFGVKGAEGVILITTKRGQEGKPQFNFSMDQGFKLLAKMPKKLDSYSAYMYQNYGIERELPTREDSWIYYTPMDIVNRYRYRQTPDDEYIYPDVDWTDAMTKSHGTYSRYNLTVGGGTNFVKYFGALAYMKEGDILNSGDQTGLPYNSQYAYERYNYRTNLDFKITPSTTFTVNLSGYLGIKHGTYVSSEYDLWRAFYYTPPGVFPVKHKDGTWGFTALNSQIGNPVKTLNASGAKKNYSTQVNTDFILKQDLDFITNGLSALLSFSFDNTLYSQSGTQGSTLLSKYINPLTGEETYNPLGGSNEYDYVLIPNYHHAEEVSTGSTTRRIFYKIQLNYTRRFGEHDFGATGLLNREEYASGSMFPRYREDWVGRVTYNYASRYFIEANGAYNGSEKFAKGYRFGFFPSLGIAYLISNEKFLNYNWLDKLKLRYTIGKVGNDNFNSTRWSYATQWAAENNYTKFGPYSENSPYEQYLESVVGNPYLQWETAVKQNVGIEVALFKNMLSIDFDLFRENRDKIFLNAGQRSMPDYFGANAPSANLGKTITKGYEFDINFRHELKNGFRFWLNYSFSHAKDKITYHEDPALLPDYQKNEGFQIGQTKVLITDRFLTSYDDIFASTKGDVNSNYRLPGDIGIIDFNGDGVINDYDRAPYGYPSRPQNTYNISGGFDYKGISFLIQFYGAYNSTRTHNFQTTTGATTCPLVYEYLDDYWTMTNPEPQWVSPRSSTSSYLGTLNYFDGSFLRLKNIEIGYSFGSKITKLLGLTSLKIMLSGNNLIFWSKLPEDREETVYNGGGTGTLYPNVKKINIGLRVGF